MVHHEVGQHQHQRGGQHQAGPRRGRPAQQLPFDPALDPAQTYILSGPFFHFDPAHGGGVVGVFTARPIPRGMTVIATPSRMPMATPMPMLANAAMAAVRQQFNPNAAPFYPKQLQHQSMLPPPPALSPPPSPSSPPLPSPSAPGSGSDVAKAAKRSSPCIMLFSSACPDGRLVPLRQPQPPVYFQNVTANNGQAADNGKDAAGEQQDGQRLGYDQPPPHDDQAEHRLVHPDLSSPPHDVGSSNGSSLHAEDHLLLLQQHPEYGHPRPEHDRPARAGSADGCAHRGPEASRPEE